MKKTEMLKKNYEFKYVLNKGKYYSGENIEAFIKKNNNSKNYLGIAISSKAGKAIQRNRLKRLIRENYSLIESNIKPGYSIIFLIKKQKNIKNIYYSDIKSDVKKIVVRAKMLHGNEKNID